MASIEHRPVGRGGERSPVRLYPGDVVDGVTVTDVDGTLVDCDLVADDGTRHHVRTIFARRSDHGEAAHRLALDAWLGKELARWNEIPSGDRGPALRSALAMRTAAKQHLVRAATDPEEPAFVFQSVGTGDADDAAPAEE